MADINQIKLGDTQYDLGAAKVKTEYDLSGSYDGHNLLGTPQQISGTYQKVYTCPNIKMYPNAYSYNAIGSGKYFTGGPTVVIGSEYSGNCIYECDNGWWEDDEYIENWVSEFDTSCAGSGHLEVMGNLLVGGGSDAYGIYPYQENYSKIGDENHKWYEIHGSQIHGYTIYEKGQTLANTYQKIGTVHSTNTSSKIYLVGTDSQGASKTAYSHDTAYVGTDGCLYSGGAKVLTSETKNTAGSTNSTSKLYLVGATTQAANPQTYSNNAVYATNGALNATAFTAAGTSPYISLQNSNDIDGDNKYNPRMISYSHSNSNDGALLDIGLYKNGYDYRTLRIKSLDSDTNVISLCEMRGGTADNHTFESFELWGRHNTVPIANGGTGATLRSQACINLVGLGNNPIEIETEDTTLEWGALGFGQAFLNPDSAIIKPQKTFVVPEPSAEELTNGYNLVLNVTSGRSSEVFQLSHDQPAGSLYHRSGNNSGWNGNGASSKASWKCLLDSKNYTNWLVPKTGGTFTGAITAPSLTLGGNITYSNGSYTDYAVIQFLTGDNNGCGLMINGGGYVGIGAGESARKVYDALVNQQDTTAYAQALAPGTEILTLSADSGILMYTNTADNTFSTNYRIKFTNGGIAAVGSISASSFTATSDRRLKENIESYTCPKSILDLDVKKFDFINGKKDQIGCIAQELQEICPELVQEGEDGYLSIQESKIVYLLLDEVKKLKAEVNNLTSKIKQ